MSNSPSTATISWFLRRLYPHYREQRAAWLLGFAMLASVHVVELAIPVFLQRGIDRIAEGDARVAGPTVALCGLAFLRFALLRFGRRQNALVSIAVSSSLRRTLYAHLQTLGRGFYARYTLGDLLARSSNDVQTIWRFFRSALYHIVSLVAIVTVAPIFMARTSLALTACVLPLLALNASVASLLARRIRSAAALVQRDFGSMTALIEQSLRGVRTIQLHGREAHELTRVRDAARAYVATQQRVVRLNAALRASTLLGHACVVCVVLGYGGSQVLHGALSVGTLTAFIAYLSLIMTVLNQASWPVFAYLNAAMATVRVAELLDETPEISDDPQARPLPLRTRGELRVHELSYRYPAAARASSADVLDDISLTLRAGELTTIVGRVGSGKTTLLRLLARQLEPSEGEVTLDDRSLDSIALAELRRTIVVVPQDAFLFSTSLAENISYDEPARPRERVMQAACSAQLAPTIARFANGLATVVGERGLTLSGGQRQRTGIARGLIRDAPVLLLDDCCSALDADTEALLIAELRQLRRGLTTVVVTHRVSAARHADRIYVLEAGRVVESGDHEELSRSAGHYARLTRVHEPPAGMP